MRRVSRVCSDQRWAQVGPIEPDHSSCGWTFTMVHGREFLQGETECATAQWAPPDILAPIPTPTLHTVSHKTYIENECHCLWITAIYFFQPLDFGQSIPVISEQRQREHKQKKKQRNTNTKRKKKDKTAQQNPTRETETQRPKEENETAQQNL